MYKLHDTINRCKELQQKLRQEEQAKAAVRYSPEYQTTEQQIAALKEQQDAMLAGLDDSSVALQEAKQEAMEMMRRDKLDKYEDVVAKFKENKEVNASRVLHVLDGDIDNYVAISSITQVALKDLAKSMPDKKNDLMACIEVTSREIVDLVIPS